jgi:hypothetical protein
MLFFIQDYRAASRSLGALLWMLILLPMDRGNRALHTRIWSVRIAHAKIVSEVESSGTRALSGRMTTII